MWPGYRENMRVLRWVVDRRHGRAGACYGPLGAMPRYQDIDWRGLDYTPEEWNGLMAYDPERLKLHLLQHQEFFMSISDHLPKELLFERELLTCRL